MYNRNILQNENSSVIGLVGGKWSKLNKITEKYNILI